MIERQNGILRSLVIRYAQSGKGINDVLVCIELVMKSMIFIQKLTTYQLVVSMKSGLPGMMQDAGTMISNSHKPPKYYGTYFSKHIHTPQEVKEGYFVAEGQECVKPPMTMTTRTCDEDLSTGNAVE